MDKAALVDMHQRLSAYHDHLFSVYNDVEAPEFKLVTSVLKNLERDVKNLPGPIITTPTFPSGIEVKGLPSTDDSQIAFVKIGTLLAKETPMNMGVVLLAKTTAGIIYYVSTFSPQMSREVMQEFINNEGGAL